MVHLFIHALCLVLAQGATPPSESADVSPTLEAGYHQMYDLQFAEAHKTFHEWERLHPQDPLAPSSDAAAYLFAEFDRLGVLQSELFVNDEKFKKISQLTPDPAARQQFENALLQSDQLADAILARSPNDSNALFAKTLNLGLRSDYVGLIDKRYLASLSYMKSAGTLSDKLLATDPTRYDAYLATGVENYMLGLNAAPVRWLLRIYGARADKEQGIAKLKLTADKGHFLLPFARLLLAVAALRDKDKNRARELLSSLAREFPHNGLYARELSLLQ
ncbi:MAG TPA: hypothetical protein VKV95_16480 [Terriglobia bacterium]|nr:hypothetical protein [Terriglobia bacterium]